MVVDGWSDERIYGEAEIGKGTIETVHEMIELGIPLPDEAPAPVYKKLPESYDQLTHKPKTETKKRESAAIAPSFEQSNLLHVVPRTFTTSSLLIFLAMQVAKREWGWNLTDPGEFLDRFIIVAMEEFGFKLAGYIKGPDASIAPVKGNGHVEVEQEPQEEEEEEIIFTGEPQ